MCSAENSEPNRPPSPPAPPPPEDSPEDRLETTCPIEPENEDMSGTAEAALPATSLTPLLSEPSDWVALVASATWSCICFW